MAKIQIKKLGKFEFLGNYVYREHAHDEIEINYISAGKCIMTIDQKKIPLRQGDCIFICPMTKHNFMVDGVRGCQIVQFEFLEAPAQLPFIEAEENLKFSRLSNCSDILKSLNGLHTYHKNKEKSEWYKKLFDLELKKLFVLLAMHKSTSDLIEKQYQSKPLQSVLEYIDHNYEYKVDFEVLSKENGVSSRYLRKIFMDQMHFSPIEYVTMLRMEKAKDLLKNTSKTVSAVSAGVGYNSLQYFSAMFKKKIGMTPKEFRQQYKL